jgi:hypothetical protein
MSFATPADLAAYLQREAFAAGAETTSAQLALDIATSTVVARTGQTFVVKTADVVTLDTHYDEDVRLPQRPVTAVTSVSTRDRGSTTTTTRTLNADYEVRGDRLRWVGIGTWPYEVTVTYDHGYAAIPDDVKGATLAVAAEIHSNPEGLARSALDDSNDAHEWADDSPAERMLKLVERRYGRKPLTVRVR